MTPGHVVKKKMAHNRLAIIVGTPQRTRLAQHEGKNVKGATKWAILREHAAPKR